MKVDQEADALVHKLINALRDMLDLDVDGCASEKAIEQAKSVLEEVRNAGFTQMEG